MILHIFTRCSKPQNLLRIKESIADSILDGAWIQWHIIFDTNILKDIDAELLESLNKSWITLSFKKHASSYTSINEEIQSIDENEGLIYILNDDNILHRSLWHELENLPIDKDILIFSQRVGGFEDENFFIRDANSNNIKPGFIDGQQYVIKKQWFDTYKFEDTFIADGLLIQKLHQNHSNLCHITDKVLSYGNSLQKKKSPRNPRVLYIGKDSPVLKTDNHVYWESNQLDVRYEKDDTKLREAILEFNPDSILTVSTNPEKDFPNLINYPGEVQLKWTNLETLDEMSGEKAYHNAMQYMLSRRKGLVSFFTPIYNTGEKLYKTYESLQKQTYSNWEWVLVNDSTDGGKTLKIAEDIAKYDFRVKVYDFREKSGGLIGEVKWRAACMATGDLLVELDHDDYLTNDCARYLMEASLKHPDVGFFYSDCVEAREDNTSIMYNEGFACGYGKYKKETYEGIEYDVCVMPNINPKTIRHIVGVPNHVRAWRKTAYFNAGGHCRNLTIADDYELLIRTFLSTKMMRIPKLLYIQYFYNDGNEMNTQDLTRADIQRRVKTISRMYNDMIKRRFEELGKVDWAYNKERAELALEIPSRYGNDEQYVNEIYEL